MIVQRSAAVGAAVPRQPKPRLKDRIPAAPNLAAGGRIRTAIERSVLVQLIGVITLVSVAAVIYLNQASKVSILDYNITLQQQQQVSLQMTNAGLYASATSLESLQRVETLATSHLHMSPARYSSALWIYPVVPRVPAAPHLPSIAAAQAQSQPLAWMKRFASFIKAQL
ncbi:MAG: hypothetical protein ACRDFX_05300 [Chloroflexota bacterium]